MYYPEKSKQPSYSCISHFEFRIIHFASALKVTSALLSFVGHVKLRNWVIYVLTAQTKESKSVKTDGQYIEINTPKNVI